VKARYWGRKNYDGRGNDMKIVVCVEYVDGSKKEIPLGDKSVSEAITVMDSLLDSDRNIKTATIRKVKPNVCKG
jgi:hypothetical protein